MMPYKNNPDDLSKVLAYLTQHPTASIREIGKALCYGSGKVQHLLKRLAELGYIEQEPGKSRARRVIIPFIPMEK